MTDGQRYFRRTTGSGGTVPTPQSRGLILSALVLVGAAPGHICFLAINRLTTLLVTPRILFLAAFLVVCLRGPGVRAGAAR